MAMNIVLVNPEIPQNTGNIARTCAATGSVLHMIKPLGFSLEDRYLKRAGLDYWKLMEYHVYSSLEDFLQQHGDCILFGKESAGIPEDILARNEGTCIRIPMREEARSLNLANSAAIVLYEALRQNGFPGLCTAGSLTGREETDGPWLDYI